MKLTPIVIRNFNDRTEVETVEDLIDCLKAKYGSMSVSLEYLKPSGIKAVAYVDVKPSGEIVESFGEQKQFDFAIFDNRKSL